MQACSTNSFASEHGSELGGGKQRCEHIMASWGAQQGTPPPFALLHFPAQSAAMNLDPHLLGWHFLLQEQPDVSYTLCVMNCI